MSAAIDAACDAAMHRLRKSINATAGQHLRAHRKAFSVREGQGQGGEGVRGAVELQVGAHGESQPLTCEVVNQALKTRAVADAINEAEFGFYVVNKVGKPHAVIDPDGAVRDAGFIANEAVKVHPAPWISGVLFRDGKYFAVDCGRLRTLDELGFEHCGPSVMVYIAKYLLKFHDEPDLMAASEGTASAQRINRGRA